MSRQRFKRLAFNIIAGVAIVPFLGTVALWQRTEVMQVPYTTDWLDRYGYHRLTFSGDDVKLKILSQGPPCVPQAPTATVILPEPRSAFHNRETRSLWLPYLGFDYAEFDQWYGYNTKLYSYRLSYFTVMLPAAAVTLLWIGIRGREWYRRRHRPGFCAKCGYDLRASAGRCPECGTTVAPQPT
jgi:hypothetical protein